MRSGKLAGFLKSIKPVLDRSRVLRLLLGAQCASMLASHVDLGFMAIIHIGGKSSLGKTALIRLAMAYVGRPNETDPKT